MEKTTRPWVLIAVGVCGLLSVAVLWKHFGGSDSEEAKRADRLAEIVAERSERGAGRGGYGTADGGDTVAGQSGAGGPQAKVAGRGDSGDAGAADAGDELGAAQMVRGGAGGRRGHVGEGRERKDGSLTVGSGEGTSGRGTAAEMLARQSREARDRIAQAGRSGTTAGALADGQEHVPDPETPVFSALKDGKLESETGVAPIAADKLEAKDGEVMFGKDSKYVIPDAGNVQGKSGAISFWVKPQWEGSEKDDAHMVVLEAPNTWENRLAINKNGHYLRFMFFPNSGQEAGVSTMIDNWQPDQQHHVAAEWGPQEQGENVLNFYVDGKLVGSDHYKGDFNVPSAPLLIGNDPSGQLGARAGMRDIEVYNTLVGPDKIRSMYGSGPSTN